MNDIKAPEYEASYIIDGTQYTTENQIGTYITDNWISSGYHLYVAISDGEYTLNGVNRVYTYTVVNYIEDILASGSGVTDVTNKFWNKVPFESIRGKYVSIYRNTTHSIGDTFTTGALHSGDMAFYVMPTANIERIRVYNPKSSNTRSIYIGRPDVPYGEGVLVEDIVKLYGQVYKKSHPKRNPQFLSQYTAYIVSTSGVLTSQYVYFTNAPKDAMPLFIIINAQNSNNDKSKNLFLVRTTEFAYFSNNSVAYAGLCRNSANVTLSKEVAYFYPDSQAVEIYLYVYCDAAVTLIY